jgi:serine/threonine-protein kinase
MSFALVKGALIADRYLLLHKIGSGGMGEVWLANHLTLEIPCAVKLIRAEAGVSPDQLERFAFEAKAAAMIRSAHVVQMLDAGVFAGTPYLVMEHLEGEDLRTRLERELRLDATETASIVAQAACALERARVVGIVHRDLKPANLFLCRDGEREILKVLDFGIAKRVGHFLGVRGLQTRPNDVLGTPSFMSPEQVKKNRPIDHRSDLWALGVIAFRCLTGQAPFKSSSTVELLMQVTAGPIPVPSLLAPVPPGFDAWWAQAASRDPDGRFQSATEMAEALRAALGLGSAPDLDERAPTGRFDRLATTVVLEEELDELTCPTPVELPDEEAFLLCGRAPLGSSPQEPDPVVTPLVPLVPVPAQQPSKVWILGALASLVLGGAVAWLVVPRPAATAAAAQISVVDPPPEAPPLAAPTLTVSSADQPASSAPPPVSVATAAPRAVVTRAALPKPPPGLSARVPARALDPPAKAPAPARPTYDPGF